VTQLATFKVPRMADYRYVTGHFDRAWRTARARYFYVHACLLHTRLFLHSDHIGSAFVNKSESSYEESHW